MQSKTGNKEYNQELIKLLKLAYDKKVAELGRGTKGIWQAIKDELVELVKKANLDYKFVLTMDTERLRGLYRWHYQNLNQTRRVNEKRLDDNFQGLFSIEERLLKQLKKKSEINTLAYLFNVSIEEIKAYITDLQLNGYNIKVWTEDGKQFVKFAKREIEVAESLDLRLKPNSVYTFGLIGDTHLGSEFSAEKELSNFYDICEARGVTEVYHTGDLNEGFKAQRFETFLGNKAIGFQDQLEYVVKNYPKRKDITTYFISGNHSNWSLQHALANFDKTVGMLRSDMKYLGHDFARVNITDKISLVLYHPNDGSSANVFSKLQNYIDRAGNVDPNRVGTITAIGHYHKVGMLKHRGVYGFYTSSFQRPSDWMNLNNLKSFVGGWIITIRTTNTGELLSLVPEYIDYDSVGYGG